MKMTFLKNVIWHFSQIMLLNHNGDGLSRKRSKAGIAAILVVFWIQVIYSIATTGAMNVLETGVSAVLLLSAYWLIETKMLVLAASVTVFGAMYYAVSYADMWHSAGPENQVMWVIIAWTFVVSFVFGLKSNLRYKKTTS